MPVRIEIIVDGDDPQKALTDYLDGEPTNVLAIGAQLVAGQGQPPRPPQMPMPPRDFAVKDNNAFDGE